MQVRLNHKGPDHPMSEWTPTLDDIIDSFRQGHQGLLPFITESQEMADFIRGYGLVAGVDVEIYVWGTTPWTVPALNHFYTYITVVQP